MLRITVEEMADRIVFRVAGQLKRPWVGELERCWRSAAASTGGKHFTVNLDDMRLIDDEGTRLLTEMHGAGVELGAAGCYTHWLIEQIASSSHAGNSGSSRFPGENSGSAQAAETKHDELSSGT